MCTNKIIFSAADNQCSIFAYGAFATARDEKQHGFEEFLQNLWRKCEKSQGKSECIWETLPFCQKKTVVIVTLNSFQKRKGVSPPWTFRTKDLYEKTKSINEFFWLSFSRQKGQLTRKYQHQKLLMQNYRSFSISVNVGFLYFPEENPKNSWFWFFLKRFAFSLVRKLLLPDY